MGEVPMYALFAGVKTRQIPGGGPVREAPGNRRNFVAAFSAEIRDLQD